MPRTNLVVPIGAHEQDVLRIGAGQHMGQQGQRRRVDPLQIVQDHAQQLIARRNGLYQPGEYTVQAVAGLDWRQGPDRRLWPRDQLQVGKAVNDDPGIVTDRREDARPPAFEFNLGSAEQLANELLEGLDQSQIRYVALVLIELSRNEASIATSDKILELAQQRRLAHPRGTLD